MAMLSVMDRQRTEIVKNVLLLGTFLQRQAGRELAGFDLNQQQFVVLKEIGEKNPVNQTDLCSALLLEKSNLSKIVAKLARMGLIKRSVHSTDGRVTLLSLTSRGDKVVRQGMRRFDDWNSSWLEPLTIAEVRRISASLMRLRGLTAETSK